MKTTIDISDPLLSKAKDAAKAQGTTLKAVVEESLQTVLQNQETEQVFKLKDSSFTGKGLRPDIDPGNWAQLRDKIYEGHES